MNRAERRKQQKKGMKVKVEPTLHLKPSEIAKAATSGACKEAMMQEINRQLLEKDKEYMLDVDTMVLWTLHHVYGFGPKRLRKFYLDLFQSHLEMRKHYELNDLYPERYKLKEIGVDVEAWYSELFDDEGNFKNYGDGSLDRSMGKLGD